MRRVLCGRPHQLIDSDARLKLIPLTSSMPARRVPCKFIVPTLGLAAAMVEVLVNSAIDVLGAMAAWC